MTDAFILDAVHTPRGKAGKRGALRDVAPIDLVAAVMRALIERTGADPSRIDDVVLGCVTQTGEQGANLAKIAALYAGWPDRVPGMTVNRFCASGLDACAIAAMQVRTGAATLVAAGGVESMTRAPMFSDRGPWFADPDVARATGFVHMGVAADTLANLAGLDREALDAYAARSHQRAAAAPLATGLVPLAGLDRDELIRPDATAASLGALPVAFADELGAAASLVRERYPELTVLTPRHTVGTSPGIADAASLLLIGSADAGPSPRARIVSTASASVEPVAMLTGNVDATRAALARANLTPAEVDVFEVNESFAAVPLSFARELGIDPERLNPTGGAISRGHPLGATGGILLATLVDTLERTGGRTGVASICGGAGVATAVVVERC